MATFKTEYLLKSASGRVFEIKKSTDGRYRKLLAGTQGNMQEVYINQVVQSDKLTVSSALGDIVVPLVRAIDLPVGVIAPKPMFYPDTADLPEILYHQDPTSPTWTYEHNMTPGLYAYTKNLHNTDDIV